MEPLDLLGLKRSAHVDVSRFGALQSTHWTYRSAQHNFIDYFLQICRRVDSFLFATHLSSPLHSSIKIYLSAVYSMHVDQSLPDHLLGWLGLQRVIYGNKQTQRLTSFTRSPITVNRMLIIHRSLYFDVQDQVMLWATSTRPFGFCPSFRIYSPFSIQHEFNPLLPLTAAATAIDSQAATTYLIMSHHQYFQD